MVQLNLSNFGIKELDEDLVSNDVIEFKAYCVCWFCHGIMKAYNIKHTFQIKLVCCSCKEILWFGYAKGIEYINSNKIENSKFQQKLKVGSVRDLLKGR